MVIAELEYETTSVIQDFEPRPSTSSEDQLRGLWKQPSGLSMKTFAEFEEAMRQAVPGGWSSNVVEVPLFQEEVIMKPSLWERLAKLRDIVPAAERTRMPKDAAQNLDKYLYGGPQLS